MAIGKNPNMVVSLIKCPLTMTVVDIIRVFCFPDTRVPSDLLFVGQFRTQIFLLYRVISHNINIATSLSNY